MNQHARSLFGFIRSNAALPTLRYSLLIGLLSVQCIGAYAIEREEALKQVAASLEKWNATKEKCGGNYSYKVHWENRLGFGHDTVIVVRNNEVAERKFNQWRIDKGAQKQTDSWTEQGEKLRTHKKGAPAETLDKLYESANKLLEKPLKDYQKLDVTFDQQGLIQKCRYIDTRYKEDPPAFGVDIVSIELSQGK